MSVPTRWTLGGKSLLCTLSGTKLSGIRLSGTRLSRMRRVPTRWTFGGESLLCTLEAAKSCARRCVRRYKRCKKRQGQPKVDRRKADGTALRRPPLLPNGRVMNAAGCAPVRPYLLDQSCSRRPKAARIVAALALARAGRYHASLTAP